VGGEPLTDVVEERPKGAIAGPVADEALVVAEFSVVVINRHGWQVGAAVNDREAQWPAPCVWPGLAERNANSSRERPVTS